MKRFVLNSVFCLLLITIFIFVTTPAMAVLEITLSGTFTPDNINTASENEKQIVVKLTYSVAPDPIPTIDDLKFTQLSGSNEINYALPATFNEGSDGDPKTYFITFTEMTTVNPIFTLTGYTKVSVRTTAPPLVDFHSPTDPADLTTFAIISDNKLILLDDHLPGLGYTIIIGDKTATIPTLPTNSPPYEILKVDWSDVSDESMQNLWTLFQGGGTLNLRVNEPSTTKRLGSKKADGTYDDNHGRDQRQVVINEVMWAQDEAFIGDAMNIAREQWIEIHNRKTTPIAYADIKFTTSKSHPAPPAETDRLSNNPRFSITWKIDDLGLHGSSSVPRREFRSMQRTDYTNGWRQAHWSIATVLYLPNYRGTPGKPNQVASVPTARTRPTQDNPAINKIIINEIGNFSDDSSDWIELRNITGSAQSLNNWVLTKTIGFGNETEIVRLPDYSIEPRGVLLLVNRHPWQTPHSLGFDIQENVVNQEFGAAPHQYLVVDDNSLAIPNDDAWLLILRSNMPWDVGSGRNVYQTGYRVEDAAGPGALHDAFVVLDLDVPTPSLEKKSDGQPDGDIWHTKVFPLNGNTQDDADFLQSDRLNTAGQVWARDGAKQGFLKDAWQKVGFTGIGYDRSVRADDQYGGTPGYHNNVAKSKLAQLAGGQLIVSELMLTTSDNRLPQWIELCNTSRTGGIDLAADSSDPITGWQLIIENHESGSWKEDRRHLNITVNLKDLFTYIPPNQTVLIVASEGRPSDRDHFPDTRVASIFRTYPVSFSMTSRKDLILNAEGGFHIKIVDSDGNVSDEVGNLDGIPPNFRRGIGLDDPYSWNWPTALTEDGHRTSLIRRRDANGQPRVGVPNRNVAGDFTGAVLPMGAKRNRNQWPQYAWVHAVDTEFLRIRTKLWYGESSDIGTPGYIRGRQLPVSLSFFRAALENGEVVIQWTTESETDNAGFNILRSHSKDGEYKQINTALIQGAGTTGQRNTYQFIDKTAKPNVAYYYRLEDIDLSGKRGIFTTYQLRGVITPTGKTAITWGTLKNNR